MFASMLSTSPPGAKYQAQGSKNYPHNRFLRVFKSPAPIPYQYGPGFDAGYRPMQPVEYPAANWYQPSAIPAPYQRPQPPNYSIYPNATNETYIYERSLCSKSDLLSTTDYDVASIATFTPSSAFSPALSIDSTLTLKSPETTDRSLPADDTPPAAATTRSATPAAPAGYGSTSRPAPVPQSYPGSYQPQLPGPNDYRVAQQPAQYAPPRGPAAIPVASAHSGVPVLTGFVSDYAESTFSEFEVEERDRVAKMNANYNSFSTGALYENSSSTNDASTVRVSTSPTASPPQSASTRSSTRDQYTDATRTASFQASSTAPSYNYHDSPPRVERIPSHPTTDYPSQAPVVPVSFPGQTNQSVDRNREYGYPVGGGTTADASGAMARGPYHRTSPDLNAPAEPRQPPPTTQSSIIYAAPSAPAAVHESGRKTVNASSDRTSPPSSTMPVAPLPLASDQPLRRRESYGPLAREEPFDQQATSHSRKSTRRGSGESPPTRLSIYAPASPRDASLSTDMAMKQEPERRPSHSPPSRQGSYNATPTSSENRRSQYYMDDTNFKYTSGPLPMQMRGAGGEISNTSSYRTPQAGAPYAEPIPLPDDTPSQPVYPERTRKRSMSLSGAVPRPEINQRPTFPGVGYAHSDESMYEYREPSRHQQESGRSPGGTTSRGRTGTGPDPYGSYGSSAISPYTSSTIRYEDKYSITRDREASHAERQSAATLSRSYSRQPTNPSGVTGMTVPLPPLSGALQPPVGSRERERERERERDREREREREREKERDRDRDLHRNPYPNPNPNSSLSAQQQDTRRTQFNATPSPPGPLPQVPQEQQQQQKPPRGRTYPSATVEDEVPSPQSSSPPSRRDCELSPHATTTSTAYQPLSSTLSSSATRPPPARRYSENDKSQVADHSSPPSKTHSETSDLMKGLIKDYNAGSPRISEDSAVSSSSTVTMQGPGAATTPFPEPHRRYSDGDQTIQGMSGSTSSSGRPLAPLSRNVRWTENLICPSPITPSQRRKGWFNRRGDQLWTNDGVYKPVPVGQEYPLDLADYPDHDEGWMNEEGVRIDMSHRLVPKVPLRSALKQTKAA